MCFIKVGLGLRAINMKTFNFVPRGDVRRTVQFLDRTIDFESGSFQVQKVGVNPIETFEMSFEGNGVTLAPLEAFYREHRKSERFLFVYEGQEYTCQFASDYTPTEKFGWDRTGRVIGKTTVDLTLRVVRT